jgi:hypothetical protein
MNDNDRIHLVQTVLSEHDSYWDNQKQKMKAYKNVYHTQYWENKIVGPMDEMLRIEIAEAYAFIEAMQSSLFNKYPGVELSSDDVDDDQVDALKHVMNGWFRSQRQELERASRLALIFPNSFIKLYDSGYGDDPFKRYKIKALEPWNVIVDFGATDISCSRWIGHKYFITVSEAKKKFGNIAWSPKPKKEYFDVEERQYNNDRDTSSVPEQYLFVRMVEFYDLLNDQIFWYSEDVENGPRIFDKSQIYPRTTYDTPMPAIIPFYYVREADRPLLGYSSLRRVYDQCVEKNVLRTWWANAVRRDSRQFLFDRSRLDEDALSKLTAGIDGALIPYDGPITGDLLAPVQVTPITNNHERYLASVESDIQRGTILAAFASGQSVKTTATEVNVLAQYTATELGKLARERDIVLETLAQCYIRMVMADVDQITPIALRDKIVLLKPETFDANFTIVALDGASTPISKAIKQQELVSLIPVLQSLGISIDKIRDEVVKTFDLPETFMEVEEEVQQPITEPQTEMEQPGGVDIAGLLGGVQ